MLGSGKPESGVCALSEFIDRVARELARGVSRREALRRFGGVLAAVLVGTALPRTAAAGGGTCPAGAKPENCRKGIETNCEGDPSCGCVKQGRRKKVCVVRVCGPACRKTKDCPSGTICVKAPGCCDTNKFCAFPCGTKPSPARPASGGWS
jgi:hypothetical protein